MKMLKGVLYMVVCVALMGVVTAQNLEVSPVFVKYSAVQDEIVRQEITLLNHGNPETVTLGVKSQKPFISIDKTKLSVDSEGSFTVLLNTHTTGIYVGRVTINKDSRVPILLEVESPSPGFDVATSSSTLQSDGTFTSDVTVYNLHALTTHASLTYTIYDDMGNALVSESEALQVSQQLVITKVFHLPAPVPAGSYVFAVTISDSASVGTSSSFITIASEPLTSPDASKNSFFLPALIIILVGVLLVLNRYWDKKLVSTSDYWSNKIHALKTTSFSPTRKEFEHLMYQKELLQKAYERGYLKKELYQAGVVKLNAALASIKKRL